MSLLEQGRVEVVTGVNLPMLIRLVSIREEERVGPAEAARAALYQGKENIYLASELLGGGPRLEPEGARSGPSAADETADSAPADSAPDDQTGSIRS